MNVIYDRLLQNLNAVKNDLKEMDNPNLDLCIKRITDTIYDAGRLNFELMKFQAIREMRCKSVDFEVDDRWE